MLLSAKNERTRCSSPSLPFFSQSLSPLQCSLCFRHSIAEPGRHSTYIESRRRTTEARQIPRHTCAPKAHKNASTMARRASYPQNSRRLKDTPPDPTPTDALLFAISLQSLRNPMSADCLRNTATTKEGCQWSTTPTRIGARPMGLLQSELGQAVLPLYQYQLGIGSAHRSGGCPSPRC